MVYDCFSFYNELDLLEIRLNILDCVVDKFVLVEATKTHAGECKELYYNQNKKRYEKFKDKIIHLIIDDFPDAPRDYSHRQASWMRENWQRNALIRGLSAANSDDIILISDIDEIPSPNAIKNAKKLACNGCIVQLNQMFFNFYLNCYNYIRPLWPGTKVLKFSTFTNTDTYEGMKPIEYVDDMVNLPPSFTRIRYLNAQCHINNAGWHFSYVGDVDAVMRKAKSIAHVEYVNGQGGEKEFVRNAITNGLDITGCGYRFFAIPLDKRFPKYLIDSQDKYHNLFMPVTKEYLRRTRSARVVCYVRGWIRRNVARIIPNMFKPVLFNFYSSVFKNPIKI